MPRDTRHKKGTRYYQNEENIYPLSFLRRAVLRMLKVESQNCSEKIKMISLSWHLSFVSAEWYVRTYRGKQVCLQRFNLPAFSTDKTLLRIGK